MIEDETREIVDAAGVRWRLRASHYTGAGAIAPGDPYPSPTVAHVECVSEDGATVWITIARGYLAHAAAADLLVRIDEERGGGQA